MDVRTGRIYTEEEIRKLFGNFDSDIRQMAVPPTPRQLARKPPRVGRNEPCPCGSGKKFKQCCFLKEGQN